ncbi:MAG: hypothetical protein IJG57_06275 [Firmicutes bacterium]|nr:hypothetical protein [Bacillota bacterium]
MLDVFFENRFNARYIMLILLVVILLFAVIARYHGMGVVNQQEEQLPDFVMNKVLEEGVTKGAGTGIDSMILKWALAAAEHPDESDAHRFDSFEGALFVGDSRTEGMKFYSGVDNADFFSGKSMNVSKVLKGETVNVGGQELSLQDLLKKKTYNKVYISLGLNELGWTSKDSFVESYGTLIDQVKEAQPDAEVFVQLLFPVSSKKSASDKVFNNANIKACNDRLTKLAEDKDVKVLDPSPPLVDTTGALKMEATSDGVHINSDYCVKWAFYLARISM